MLRCLLLTGVWRLLAHQLQLEPYLTLPTSFCLLDFATPCVAIPAISPVAQPAHLVLPYLQLVVGTHGKLKNWVSKKQMDISNIKILVFDEADEMLKVSVTRGSYSRQLQT